VGRSRNRGRKGHRILRRVLVGGSHLGSSRAIALHGVVATAVLAASSRGNGDGSQGSKPKTRREGAPISCARGIRDRGVRGSIARRRRGKTTPTLLSDRTRHGAAGRRQAAASPTRIRRSVRECRETLGPPVKPHGAQDSESERMRSTRRKSRQEPGTHEVRVHADRSGGRSRSDASRVLSSGRSQGLVESQGASPKEARSTA